MLLPLDAAKLSILDDQVEVVEITTEDLRSEKEHFMTLKKETKVMAQIDHSLE